MLLVDHYEPQPREAYGVLNERMCSDDHQSLSGLDGLEGPSALDSREAAREQHDVDAQRLEPFR